MNVGENLHAGHRERMTNKLIKFPDALTDHEILEIALFSLIPRKDTNALAHSILNAFGSLDNVFHASADKLKLINGVGDRVAAGIIAMGVVSDRIAASRKPKIRANSFDAIKSALLNFYADKNEETFAMMCLDKNYKEIAIVTFTDNQKNSVSVEIPEILNAISIHKPTYALVAHNHISGNFTPSKADILTTKKLNIICELHSVRLVDHVIVSNGEAISLHNEGTFESILENASLNNLFSKF